MGHKAKELSAEYAHRPSGISRTHALQRFSNILDRIPAGELDELGALDDAGFLHRIDEHLAAQEASVSAVARARERGAKTRKRLFKSADVMTVEQAAELLEIKPESVVKKIQRGGLLAIEFGGRKYIPSFQFRNHRVAPEVPRLLEALGPLGGFTRLDWFLSPHPDLGDRKPADLVGQQSDDLLQAARRYGTQGGA